MDERSKEADDQWQKVFNEYKYRTPPSEEQTVADTRQILLNSRKRGLDEAANLMAKQLLRTGSSSNIGKVYQQASDEYAKSLEGVNLNAKRIGREQFRQDQDSELSMLLKELSALQGTADQTTTSPVNFSNFNESLTGRGDAALQQLSQTLAQGSNATRQALQQYAQGVANTKIDLSGVAQALAGLGKGGGSQKDEYFPPRPGQSDGMW